MAPKRRRAWPGFALSGLLAFAGLFALDAALGGVALFVAMLVFVAACIHALRGHDAGSRRQSDRTGLAGWVGGWF